MLAGHLSGASTLALASTDERGWCKWVCLDADATDALPPLVALAGWLAADGLPGVLEASRRGGHLWLLFDEALPALSARYCVRDALDRAAAAGLPLPALELYPDRAAGGLGHAMRLPLGVHRRTQRRYPLLDQVGMPLPGGVQEGATYLIDGASRVRAGLVEARWEHNIRGLRAAASAPTENGIASASSSATRSGVIRWVDAHVSPLRVLDELAPGCAPHRSGQGYLGWCPFHDDRAPDADGRPGSPSFYVVHNARFGWSWRCLSPNCLQHAGPMRHTFRLFQELLRLDAPSAIRAAAARWPEATAGVP